MRETMSADKLKNRPCNRIFSTYTLRSSNPFQKTPPPCPWQHHPISSSYISTNLVQANFGLDLRVSPINKAITGAYAKNKNKHCLGALIIGSLTLCSDLTSSVARRYGNRRKSPVIKWCISCSARDVQPTADRGGESAGPRRSGRSQRAKRQ